MAQIPIETPSGAQAKVNALAATLAPVAAAGTYASLTDKPVIPDSADDIGAQPVGNYLRRVVHNGTSYEARPIGVAAGLVEYLGPTQPTDWLDKDTWIQTS